MSEAGTRPGGLTALAVINFVLGGFGLLGAATTPLTPRFVAHAVEAESRAESRAAAAREERGEAESGPSRALSPEEEEKRRKKREDLQEAARIMNAVPMSTLLIVAAVEAVIAILLIVSGVGYLKLRRGLGLMLGTVYAVLAIGWTVLEMAYMSHAIGKSFGLLQLVGFIYPLITLFCLRVMFRHDFVNP